MQWELSKLQSHCLYCFILAGSQQCQLQPPLPHSSALSILLAYILSQTPAGEVWRWYHCVRGFSIKTLGLSQISSKACKSNSDSVNKVYHPYIAKLCCVVILCQISVFCLTVTIDFPDVSYGLSQFCWREDRLEEKLSEP